MTCSVGVAMRANGGFKSESIKAMVGTATAVAETTINRYGTFMEVKSWRQEEAMITAVIDCASQEPPIYPQTSS